jgi:hypothetical protein
MTGAPSHLGKHNLSDSTSHGAGNARRSSKISSHLSRPAAGYGDADIAEVSRKMAFIDEHRAKLKAALSPKSEALVSRRGVALVPELEAARVCRRNGLTTRLSTENDTLVVHFLYRKIFQMRPVMYFHDIYRGGQRSILQDER